MPNPSLVRRHKGLLRHTMHQLLHVDVIRFLVARARYDWFTRLGGGVRTFDSGDGVAANTVDHNLKGLRDLAVARSLYLLRPVSVLDDVPTDADVLLIGPRTEGEILALLAHGFDLRRTRAVDLISYSPWVDLGDMHALPYERHSFDVVVAGWVLAYSEQKSRAAAEIVRVARPGATVAVGVEWNSRSDVEIERDIGYNPGSTERLRTVEDILALFEGTVDRVLAQQSPEDGVTGTRSIVVVFRLKGGTEY